MTIIEIQLLTNSLAETRHFYNEVMGFKQIKTTDNQLSIQIGTTVLHFLESQEVHKPVYHFAFDIPENKLLEALEWIRQRATLIPFETKEIIDFSNWHAKSFYFYDNNGNILECIVRYDFKTTSDEIFSAASFLKMSEIGFVTKDVLQFCDEINAKYEIDFFTMQPKGDSFSVLGDQSGLFIVSGTKRNWFPTEKKAIPFWSQVVFENNSKFWDFIYNPLN